MTESIDQLVRADQGIFLWLNGQHTPWLDSLMYWITFKFTWIPMYLGLIWLTFKGNWKQGAWIIVTVLAAVIIADQITSGFMKPFFLRPRPCHDPQLMHEVHVVAGCGGMYGFASSHASTSFALALTWFALLKPRFQFVGWLFVWAAIYSYSRVYVGVHYPGDIIVGALVGLSVGWACLLAHNSFLKKYYLS